ncbi:HNH endonuclease [Candidatus Poriferisodalis sp.]|uniref:HNH endonuclease n=1 Tax=Candidatus Poriferisodalis sp. TaxID=3101277 RepID=UPI003D127A48
MGALLLLRPRRDAENLADSIPVMCKQGYLLTKIGLGPDIQFDDRDRAIVASPTYVSIKNEIAEQTVWFDQRWAVVEQLHQLVLDNELPDLPNRIVELLDQHRLALELGPASVEAIKTTSRIFRWLDSVEIALISRGRNYVRNLILGTDDGDGISSAIPITLDQLALDDIPMRIQRAGEMRLSNIRGSSGARFSKEVRRVWDDTCAFCSLRLPGDGTIGSGVDAAHILPWRHFDLDRVDNGVCLCKLHHWAFDQMLLAIRHKGGKYYVEGTVLLERIGTRERDRIASVVGEIPHELLPSLVEHRPNPVFIERFYAGIDLTLLT